jgi:hypothetical protein
MTENPRNRIRPHYSDFEDLDAAFQEDGIRHPSNIAVAAGFLRHHTTSGVVAILTLIVFGIGFYTTDDIWGLLAVDVVIALFSTFAIVFGETRGNKKEEAPCGAHESRNESAGAPET